MKNTIELGDKVKDKVTGFEGIVVSTAQCINGCDRAVVQPPIDKEGKHPESIWFDFPQLEIVKKNVVKKYEPPIEKPRASRTGGPPSKGMP